jgi:hypothetical protein
MSDVLRSCRVTSLDHAVVLAKCMPMEVFQSHKNAPAILADEFVVLGIFELSPATASLESIT